MWIGITQMTAGGELHGGVTESLIMCRLQAVNLGWESFN